MGRAGHRATGSSWIRRHRGPSTCRLLLFLFFCFLRADAPLLLCSFDFLASFVSLLPTLQSCILGCWIGLTNPPPSTLSLDTTDHRNGQQNGLDKLKDEVGSKRCRRNGQGRRSRLLAILMNREPMGISFPDRDSLVFPVPSLFPPRSPLRSATELFFSLLVSGTFVVDCGGGSKGKRKQTLLFIGG